MIICSNSVDAEGNFPLMNVDAPVSVKANLQAAENEGKIVKISESPELQNGISRTASEGKCPLPIHQTNGEVDDNVSPINQQKSVPDENGSSEDLFESNVVSESKFTELLNINSSVNFVDKNSDSNLDNDPSHSLSCEVLTKIDTEVLNGSLASLNVPATANGMPYESTNLQELSAMPANSAIELEKSLQNWVKSIIFHSQQYGEVKMPITEKTVDVCGASASNCNSEVESVLLSDHSSPSILCETPRESSYVNNDSSYSDLVEGLCDSAVVALKHSSVENSGIMGSENTCNKLGIGSLEGAENLTEVQISSHANSEKTAEQSGADTNIHSMDMKDFANLKVECSHYKSENEQLQHQLSLLTTELNSFKSQQSQLLLTIEQQEKQLKQINENAKRQQELDEKSYAAFKQELESQNEKLKQEWATMKHEKEVSVMRYAKSEMDVIKLREKAETCQKKLQEAIKERDSAQANMKQLISDKSKYSQMYDNKCSEVRIAHNEIEQLKSDLNSKNHKLKWTQNKLKEEQDSHKETQSKLDEVTGTIEAARKEAEQAKVDAQASIKKFQVSQENRAFVLEQQLKEEQAKLILARAEKDDLDKKIQQLTNKLQQAETEVKTLNEKNNRSTDQLQTIEKEKLEMEVKLSTMQQLMNKEVQENVELESQLSEMRNLRLELEEEKKKLETLETEAIQLRSSNAELLIDMDSCRKKEAETLEFTQRLTAQNVKLQTDYSALLAKNEELEMEQSKIDDLKAELEKEKSQRLEENKLLARHVAEHSQRCEELAKQLAEQKSENVVLRRKNAATIRELTRELQQAKKQFTEHSDGGGSGSNSLCQDSRASSCASLTDTSQALSSNLGSITVEPDKQTLIERIVELQRRNAQYLEKVEFLEEHNQEMTEELKKKTKILQNFMLREPVGALSSNSMDNNKLALSKKGYMASLYSSKIKDKNMTLEKSLEICQTLHSLLEDTILKNITLKENMDTLGEEIARLRCERMKEGES